MGPTPTVGAKLEEVQRPRSLFGPDYLRLAALVLVAIAVHGWLISHTSLTARDSLGFARQALCFENPSAAPPNADGRPKNTLDHIRAAEHPPGYPLAVWATDSVLRYITPERSPQDRALLACQLANAIAATLLVIPTYLLGRMLFSRNVGFAAALLFQVLPVPARITSDGLTEGVYLLAASVAIVLGVRAVRRPRISGFLLCGLATGVSYLVRPEGLMIAAAPGAVALWLGITRHWPRDVAFGRLTALVIGVTLVAVPYMAMIGKITNKTSPGEMLNNPIGPPRSIIHDNTLRVTTSTPLFAAWWNDEKDSGKSRELWAVQSVGKELSKSANYVVWPLAIFAIIALRRKFATEPGLWVLTVLIACNVALLLFLALRVGYVSERHTVLLTMLACVFAAAGLPLLAAGIGQLLLVIDRLGVRITAASILVALVVSSLPFALKPMHPHREGHKHAGEWLASRMSDNDAIVDPFCWAEWYAGRTLYRISWNPPVSRSTYVIWENTTATPHSRLPALPVAKELLQHPTARIVYHWPENVPKEEATVQVWKLGAE